MKGFPFNTEMALAVCEGRKPCTRRPMKWQPTEIFEDPVCVYGEGHSGTGWYAYEAEYGNEGAEFLNCPYSPGEVVYMQEPWGAIDLGVGYPFTPEALLDETAGLDTIPSGIEVIYQAGCSDFIESLVSDDLWLAPKTMPQWATRLYLRLTVRPERLLDITEEEARAEGILDRGCLNCGESEPCGCSNPQPDARDAFVYLWDSIYGKTYPWSSSPWVWRYGLEEVWRR